MRSSRHETEKQVSGSKGFLLSLGTLFEILFHFESILVIDPVAKFRGKARNERKIDKLINLGADDGLKNITRLVEEYEEYVDRKDFF